VRDRLDGVAVFVEAVEAGSFARAGDRLALTRSAVGKTIARLEERLGVRLFHRTPRSQILTEDGQIYYERCQRALGELRTAENLLETGRRDVAGRLKIALPLLFGRLCVQPILLDLAREHPKLELDLRFTDKIVDIVGEGFDLAIRNTSPVQNSGLHVRKIATQGKAICASPLYLQKHGIPKTIDDLSNHDALVYWRNDQHVPWTLRSDTGELVEPHLNWRLQFDNHEAIADAAVRGMGIAWMHDWLVHDHLKSGRLVSLLEKFPSPRMTTYVLWPSTQYIPMKLRVTIDTLAAKLDQTATLGVPI
jgi:DNA-binding transcriptional LysR family regulator